MVLSNSTYHTRKCAEVPTVPEVISSLYLFILPVADKLNLSLTT